MLEAEEGADGEAMADESATGEPEDVRSNELHGVSSERQGFGRVPVAPSRYHDRTEPSSRTTTYHEFVERAHESGIAINAWTVPSRHDADALEIVGVDGIIVDRPEVCLD